MGTVIRTCSPTRPPLLPAFAPAAAIGSQALPPQMTTADVVRAFREHTSAETVEARGAYSNIKAQVRALEELREKLPSLDTRCRCAAVVTHPSRSMTPSTSITSAGHSRESANARGVDHTTVLTILRERDIPTRDAHGRPRIHAGDPR
jgi:hypothetical protein